ASISWSFMGRLMGPKLAVPSVRAGGAVEEPAAWICTATLGYCFLNSSAHRVIMLARLSEPTLDRLPETPPTLVYAGRLGSTLVSAVAAVVMMAALALTTTEAISFLKFMESLRDEGVFQELLSAHLPSGLGTI